MTPFQKIVFKVGTSVLTRPDGLLDVTTISQLVDQIAEIKKTGLAVILVSSGAVGAGKAMMQVPEDLSKVVRRQVLSAIGQVKLMETYRQLFANHRIFCAQVLATKEDFRDRVHYLNMKNCFQALLRDDILPIVNENDVVAIGELMFTDNDELAGLVAAMTNADALILLSSVDGLLDGPPDDPHSRLIPQIDPDEKKWLQYISPSRSSFGRGGMHTKLRVAQKAAKVGTTAFIANGKRPGILLDILKGKGPATMFRAKGTLSNVKKWIAFNENERKGQVIINRGAEEAIRSNEKISSLLPVGVIAVEGSFQKGDLIEIFSQHRQSIGLGIAQYGAETARQNMGQQGKKPLIHYDYLFVEKEGD